MNILDIKINKEKLKQLAKNSVLFSVSPEELNDFTNSVDSIEENDIGSDKIIFLINQFEEEKANITKTLEIL